MFGFFLTSFPTKTLGCDIILFPVWKPIREYISEAECTSLVYGRGFKREKPHKSSEHRALLYI